MNERAVHRAVACVFVRINLQPSTASPLPSRDVMDRCLGWCEKQRLFAPSPQELADAMRVAGYVPHKSNGQRLWCGAEWRVDPDPFIALAEPDMLRRLTQQPAAFPLRVFTELAGIGRSTFYALSKRGEAPRSYRRGRRVFIAATDAVTWCAERGKHASVLAIVDRVEDRWASIDCVRRHARG
jgi:predicted DNA-binding transcriptional regulator AlpA